MSLFDEIRKALKGEKKSDFIDQILKEKGLYDALRDAGYTIVVDDPQARARQQPFGLLSTLHKIDLVELITEITKITAIDLIRTIEVIGAMPDLSLRGDQGAAFKQNTRGVDAYVSPTGFADDDSKWSGEVFCYDGNTTTGASTDIKEEEWTSFITFTIAEIRCNKVQIYAEPNNAPYDLVDIDVFKDGAWLHVYIGDLAVWWDSFSFSEGNVTKARIRFYMNANIPNYQILCEVRFWQLSTTGGEMVVKQLEKDRTISSITDVGTWTPFSTNVTADVKAPDAGYKLKVLAAFYYCPEDVITELRFKETGSVVLALPTLGSVGMNPIFAAKPKGGADEVLELYVESTALCRGWVVTSQSLT